MEDKPFFSPFFRNPRMKKAIIKWDMQCPGFGIRFNANGTSVYIAKINRNGNASMHTIGSVEIITTDAARQLVERMKILARHDEDPGQVLKSFFENDQKPERIASSITFGAYFEIYIRDYAKVYKSSWKKDEQRIKLYVLEEWKDRRLASITSEDFIKIFRRLTTEAPKPVYNKDGSLRKARASKGRTIAANRLKETVTTIFNQAINSKHLPKDFENPTTGIKSHEEDSRQSFVPQTHLPRLLKAIMEYPQELRRNLEGKKLHGRDIRDIKHREVCRNALLLMVHLGLRTSECLLMQWDWFDFESGMLIIPGYVFEDGKRIKVTKNGKPHYVPISETLERLVKTFEKVKGNPYLFPSYMVAGKSITSLSKAWKPIRKKAQFPFLWVHDLRRTFGCSILKQTKSKEVVRDLLNHTDGHVTSTYAFLTNEELRPVLEEHGLMIERMMSEIPIL